MEFTKAYHFSEFFRNLSEGSHFEPFLHGNYPSKVVYREKFNAVENTVTIQFILNGITDIEVAPEHRAAVKVDWKLNFTANPAEPNLKDDWRLAQITFSAEQQIPFYVLCNNKAFDESFEDFHVIAIFLKSSHPANWMKKDEVRILEDNAEDWNYLAKHNIHVVPTEGNRVSLNL